MPGSGAVRAGRAFVELFTDSNKLYRGLDDAKRRLQSWGAGVMRLGAGLGLGGGGIFAPLAKLAQNAASYGADIKGIAGALGITTEEASGMAGAFEAAGVSLDEFKGIAEGLTAKITAAADANAPLIEGLDRITELRGLNLVGKGLPEQLDMIAEGLSRVQLSGDALARVNDLGLGKLLPYLKRGKAGLDELREAGKDAVIPPEQAERGFAAQKSLNAVWMAGKYALIELGAAVLPTSGEMRGIVKATRDVVSGVREWIVENRDAIAVAAKVAGGVAAVGAGLFALGAVASGVGAGIGVFVAALKLAASAAALVVSPVGLVVAAVAGLGYLFVTQTETGAKMFADLKTGFGELADTAKTAGASIVQSLKIGDVGGAMRTGLAALNLEWAKAVAYWTDKWNGFKGVFVDGWYGAIELGKRGWVEFTHFLSESWNGAIHALAEGALWAAGKIITAFEAVQPFGKVGDAVFAAAREKLTGINDALNAGEKERAAAAEKDHKRRVDDLHLKGHADEFERRKGRAGDLAGANEAVAKAQQEFADALKAGAGAVDNKAKADDNAALKAAAEAGIIALAMNNVRSGMDAMRGPNGVASSAKGAFTFATGAGQFGYADQTAKRQLDAMEGVNKKADALPEMRDQLKDLNNNLMVR